MIRLLVCFVGVAIPCISWGQTSNIMYPDFFSAYHLNMAFANVGHVPTDARADFAASYRFQTGPFKQINTTLFSGAKVVEQENGNRHVVRLLFLNEKQGPFFSSPRGYANYAYQLQLGEGLNVSAGMAFGMVEKYYAGTAAAGNTSVLLPDASSGIMANWKNFQLGIASLQLFNVQTRSLSSDLLYKRFYHLHARQQWSLNDAYDLRIHGIWRLLPVYQDEWVVGMDMICFRRIVFGLLARSNYEASAMAELIVESSRDVLRLFFNYNTPFFSPTPYTRTTIELGVGYLIR